MSFREKIAWASFVTTVLAWGAWFAVVIVRLDQGGGHDPSLFWLFIAATVAQVVLMAAVAAVSAMMAPADARAAVDERDRAVGQRASAVAYFVVLVGIAGIVVWLHLGLHGVGTIFALIGLFILGEAVRFGAKAIGYRIGG